ncbi:multimerin-2-like isoform X4 [Parambassis ranga]|uniref:Multimerin-2-like isoform X4 n=1 Tax=Parambassis ranga TaxID=210632 RepID=A0A6P7I0W5_9TELE|nr:multimerin-2-like isoform X4 [Parambassis ranga]
MDVKVFLLLGLTGLVSCDLPFKRRCIDPEDTNTAAQPTVCSNYKNIESIYGEIATLKNKVSFLEAQKQIASGNFNQTEKRLDETEKQLRENKGTVQNLETRTEAAFNDTKELLRLHKSELSNLNTTAQNLQLRLEARLTATKTNLEAEVEKIKNTDKALEAKLTEQANKFLNVEDQLGKVKAAVNTWQKVAFSASITEGANIFTGPSRSILSSTLVFNNVFTNIGNAYNSQTGIFTAPVKGVYQFTFMTFGYNSYTSGAILVKNGIYQVSTWEFKGPDYSDTASNTVILQLNQNDTVNMILWQGGKIHAGVFSGFLLFTVS